MWKQQELGLGAEPPLPGRNFALVPVLGALFLLLSAAEAEVYGDRLVSESRCGAGYGISAGARPCWAWTPAPSAEACWVAVSSQRGSGNPRRAIPQLYLIPVPPALLTPPQRDKLQLAPVRGDTGRVTPGLLSQGLLGSV